MPVCEKCEEELRELPGALSGTFSCMNLECELYRAIIIPEVSA